MLGANPTATMHCGLKPTSSALQLRKLIELAFGKTPVDDEILFLNIASVTQGLPKCSLGLFTEFRTICEIADSVSFFCLLRLGLMDCNETHSRDEPKQL
jgi:hypothetical protein